MQTYLPLVADTPRPESSGNLRFLFLTAGVAALGSLLFGFDTAVISGATDALRHAFALNDNLLGFTVSSALIGTMVGALASGRRIGGDGVPC